MYMYMYMYTDSVKLSPKVYCLGNTCIGSQNSGCLAFQTLCSDITTTAHKHLCIANILTELRITKPPKCQTAKFNSLPSFSYMYVVIVLAFEQHIHVHVYVQFKCTF